LQQLELQPLNLKAWHMNLKWYWLLPTITQSNSVFKF
jgi:hypothetical protein